MDGWVCHIMNTVDRPVTLVLLSAQVNMTIPTFTFFLMTVVSALRFNMPSPK